MNWSELDLKELQNFIKNADGKVILGIDGIIDEVWQIIETRKSKSEYSLINNMRDFGELIVERGSGGLAKELVSKRRMYGGFTANTGRAIVNLGLDTTLIGMYGETKIDPAFKELSDVASLVSLGEPIICNIFEFTDGKIMMPNLKSLLDFEWDTLIRKIGADGIKNTFGSGDIVCLGYWSNMPDFDNMLTHLVEDYFTPEKQKRIFFDFANLTKKSVDDLKVTLNLMALLNKKIPMTLSLNEHEGRLICKYYGFDHGDDADSTLKAVTSLREVIDIDEIVVHTPFFAVAASKTEGTGLIMQNFSPNPVKTTGAGDSFNGGYIVASLGSLDLNQRLAMANAVTSFYINNGYPSNREELTEEINRISKIMP